MVSIRNIEKFFSDHPELWEKKFQILGRADNARSRKGVIPGGLLKEIFGGDEKLLDLFCAEIASKIEHIRIGLEDIRK